MRAPLQKHNEMIFSSPVSLKTMPVLPSSVKLQYLWRLCKSLIRIKDIVYSHGRFIFSSSGNSFCMNITLLKSPYHIHFIQVSGRLIGRKCSTAWFMTWHDLTLHVMSRHDSSWHSMSCLCNARVVHDSGWRKAHFKPRAPSFGGLGDRFLRSALEAKDLVLYKKKVLKKEIFVIRRLVVGVIQMMVSDVENNAW